jgi:hypothetical protein
MPQIVSAVGDLQRNERFRRTTRRLLGDVRELTKSMRVAAVFGHGLFRELSRFVGTLPNQRIEIEQLHPLRIASKRLRYAIEASTEIWPDLALAELVELLKATQAQLGSLHDAVIRDRRLEEINVDPPDAVQRESDAANRGIQTDAFWSWWQTQPLEKTLANATAEIVSLMRREPIE